MLVYVGLYSGWYSGLLVRDVQGHLGEEANETSFRASGGPFRNLFPSFCLDFDI